MTLPAASLAGSNPGLGGPTDPVIFSAVQGRIALFTTDATTFNRFDPVSWGATNADGTLATPIAVWDLKIKSEPPDPIPVPNPGDPVPVQSESVVDPGNNPAAMNTLADPLGGGESIFNLKEKPIRHSAKKRREND